MNILTLPLPYLGLYYQTIYDNKSGDILSLRIFAEDEDGLLQEMNEDADYTIDYYNTIYSEMAIYINKCLIDGSSTQ